MTALLELVHADTAIRRVASTDGGEWAGPCPACGGHDRFRVWPDRERPGYFCRQCGIKGDAVQYLRDVRGASFAEARGAIAGAGNLTAPIGRAGAPRPQGPPSQAWQAWASAIRHLAQQRLREPVGAMALRYLRECRGLTDATIDRWGLGYVPRDLHDPPERWGLEPWTDQRGRPGRVFLPHGILISCEVGGVLWYLKVRRPLLAPDGQPDELGRHIGGAKTGEKYLPPKGARPALFGADTLAGHEFAVHVEGEFDAMLLEQTAGDLVGVCTMGSASNQIAGDWLIDLCTVRRLLVALDADAAGQQAAARVAGLSERARVVRLPVGVKDITDLHGAGGDLRSWVQYQIELHSDAPPWDDAATEKRWRTLSAHLGHIDPSAEPWASLLAAIDAATAARDWRAYVAAMDACQTAAVSE
jgi:DNA primase